MPSLPLFTSQRNLLIAGGVVLLHVGALWALNAGLLRRAVEIVVPVEAISEMLTPAAKPAPPPPSPRVTPPAPAPAPAPQARVPAPTPEKPTPAQPVPELRAAAPSPAPSPHAPAAQPAPPMTATPPGVAPAPAPVAAAAPPPPRIELPSSDADYLQNPRPAYPPASRRLGEQGKVVVRVLIGVDGSAQRAEIRQSSGFERLDQAALQTVLRWRYVPGKREGAPEAMWFNVPINFVLE